MALSFKRITSSGNFIPEIDGLRFIAIASVIFYHLSGFLDVKAKTIYTDRYFSVIKHILANGSLGVPLFFVISGFILGMPFAKFYLNNDKPVSLKSYFLRRLTRLEPPYILVMTALFFASVLIVKKITFSEGVVSYFSSIFYVHNFVYGKPILPLLNPVAWSLEIEVQFYILAPLLARIFMIKPALMRRIAICTLLLLFDSLRYLMKLPVISLLDYIQYFLLGFLLVDIYISKKIIIPPMKSDWVISLIFFVLIWFCNKKYLGRGIEKYVWELLQMIFIFLFYYYILINKSLRLLSTRMITNIGGMCYSIYLIHSPIISMLGNPLLRHRFSQNPIIEVCVFVVILLLLIMVISSTFFLAIEKPCMDKNWYKKLFHIKRKPLFLDHRNV